VADTSFTPDQRRAIEGRGGAIYVSAAAGSGKTAVLVERVVDRIVNGGSVDRLLVVTFTVAAASEMRRRIHEALQALLIKEPGNRHLMRQQILLHNARICTIDSYCSELVRSHFHILGVPPDFGVSVGADYELMREAALNDALEAAYSGMDSDFADMVENFGNGRDDSALFNALLSLQQALSADPDPAGFRARALEVFGEDRKARQALKETVKDYARGRLADLAGSFERVCAALDGRGDERLSAAVLPLMREDMDIIAGLCDALSQPGFTAARSAFSGARFSSFPSLRGYADDTLKQRSHSLHGELKKQVADMADGIFSMSDADIEEDAARLYPMVRALFRVEEDFEKRLRERLLRRGLLSFPEIARLAMTLLVEKYDRASGRVTPTELAVTLSGELDEVMIDEYQDTNLLQDIVFTALSDGGRKLFCVGDGKQSIYRFRQAMPEIFEARKESARPFGEGFPALVWLSDNFRSRSGILDFTNFVFGQIMSKRVGGTDYTGGERLRCGARYPDVTKPQVELHILRAEESGKGSDGAPAGETATDADDGGPVYSPEASARYTARAIKSLIDGGFSVYDRASGAMRPCRPSDCAVLLRSASVNGEIFRRALESEGLPAYCETSSGFFDSYEIAMMLEVLSAVDNPHRDIPLLAALRSPVFGFTAEMLARLRIGAGRESLYESLRRAAQADAHCARALKRLEGYRLFARNMPTHRLIWHIYTESGLLALAGGLSRGPERQHNLRQLYRHAAAFESSAGQGLAGFVRFIRRMLEQGHTLDGAQPAPAGEAVRVMTIHKAKGLEFPVVAVACCEKQFNTEDFRDPLYVHWRFGVGAGLRDPDRRLEYTTLFREAIRIQMRRELVSEEMRILYVAMTRAREKLILVAVDKDLEGHVQRLSDKLAGCDVLDPRWVENAKSFYDWLLCCALRHPDAAVLRAFAAEPCPVQGEAGRLTVVTADAREYMRQASETRKADLPADAAQASPELISAIRGRLEYAYPYETLSRVPAKVSVSELKAGRMPEEDAEPFFKGAAGYTVPRFAAGTAPGAAERGTAMHKFMQFSDFALCEKGFLEDEIERLVRQAYLFEEEAASLDRAGLAAFFKGPLYARMKRSPCLTREYRFQAVLPAREVEPALTGSPCGDETVLLQGVADCFFEEDGALVLVDYKTDRVRDGALLAERYAGQLRLYARALSQIFSIPVKELVLYSFELGREIFVEAEQGEK